MKIAYLGLDEVNRFFTSKWARRMDAGVTFVDVQEQSVSPRCPVVVVDLDSLPATHRQRWIGWLTSCARETPALVFGHTVSDEESANLRGSGVRVVQRTLRAGMLHRFIEQEIGCAA